MFARAGQRIAGVIQFLPDRVPPHGVARWQQGRPRCAFAWLAVRAALRVGIGDLGWVWVASLNRDLQNPDDRCDDGAEWLAWEDL